MFIGGENMLDINGVAELLKMHVNTINKLVKEGMPSYKIGKNRRFDEDEVVEWIKTNRKG